MKNENTFKKFSKSNSQSNLLIPSESLKKENIELKTKLFRVYDENLKLNSINKALLETIRVKEEYIKELIKEVRHLNKNSLILSKISNHDNLMNSIRIENPQEEANLFNSKLKNIENQKNRRKASISKIHIDDHKSQTTKVYFRENNSFLEPEMKSKLKLRKISENSDKYHSPSKFMTQKIKLPNSPSNLRSHYDRVFEISNRFNNRNRIGLDRVSFLSMKEEDLKKLVRSRGIKELFKITNKESEFIDSMRVSNDEKLIEYFDTLRNISRDYLNLLQLIYRIKVFLNLSTQICSSPLIQDTCNTIIKNACEVLECDRTTLFVYDKLSDMLVAHSGQGSQIKVPINKGIVGSVFHKGEPEKVDDAYLDERFNQDIDVKTGYKTKSLLCSPLKNPDGGVFGVIQSINKKIGVFNADDEEIMEIFAKQSSLILSNSIDVDENKNYLYLMKTILESTIRLLKVNAFGGLTDEIEKLMMIYWTTNHSKFYILNKEKTKFLHYSNYNCEEFGVNLGIVGHSFKKKTIECVSKADDNGRYNSLIDINTGGAIITFPIYDSEFNQVLAVAQSAYPYSFFSDKKPRDTDLMLINYLGNSASYWIENYYNKS